MRGDPRAATEGDDRRVVAVLAEAGELEVVVAGVGAPPRRGEAAPEVVALWRGGEIAALAAIDEPGIRARAELTKLRHLSDDPIRVGYGDLIERCSP